MIVFTSNELATVNPIVSDSSKVPVLNNVSGVIEELIRLKDTLTYQRLRISDGFDYATGLLDKHGNDASRCLAQLVSELTLSKKV